jgi:uncharacterized protein (TIGR03437 family)
MRSIKTTLLFLTILAGIPGRSLAQSYDSSGDGMLNGVYYIRQVIYQVSQNDGSIADAANTYGNITFDGGGHWSFSGWSLDAASSSTTPQQFTSSGSYVVSASGMGYISAINTNLVSATDQIIGLVSHGIFIGSTTQNTEGYNDMVIAAPVGSVATNATLNGSYAIAYMDPSFAGDALLTMNANGQGNIGTVNVTSYIGTNNAATSQTLTGVTYAFTNGAAQLNFGGNNTTNLIGGTELLYISPDGSFVFGGSANGFDMFAGVRNATSNPSNYEGLYYQAGLDLDELTLNSGYVLLDSYYGSINVFSGNIIGHQSLNSQLVYGGASDFSYYDNYTLNGDGSSDDGNFAQHYLSSGDGTIRVGYGASPGLLSLNVAIQGPSFSGPGVYLFPNGMVNAASSTPFTAHLSPGEFLTLLGTGLAPSAASATTLPLPPTLNGVQVMINGRAAPIQFVSPGQINVIVPFFTESIAQIQVINNGNNSNVVTQFVGSTSAGVFTFPEGGIGNAAALHAADFSLVSDSSPAQAGETVAVYLAGMGTVNPAINDGAAGPGGPNLSNTVNAPQVFIEDSAGNFPQATVTYSGLAPGFAGLYQINFVVPSGLNSGRASLEILPPDSDTFESLLPVGTPTTAAATPAARAKAAAQKHPLIHHRRLQR